MCTRLDFLPASPRPFPVVSRDAVCSYFPAFLLPARPKSSTIELFASPYSQTPPDTTTHLPRYFLLAQDFAPHQSLTTRSSEQRLAAGFSLHSTSVLASLRR